MLLFLPLVCRCPFATGSRGVGTEHGKRDEGEFVEEAGRINVAITVNNKLKMDFDGLL